MPYTFDTIPPNCRLVFLAWRLPTLFMLRRALSDLFAIFPPWFFIMLAVGILDALFQFSDYREWRKERRESGNVKE
jgi:hypothetical protein